MPDTDWPALDEEPQRKRLTAASEGMVAVRAMVNCVRSHFAASCHIGPSERGGSQVHVRHSVLVLILSEVATIPVLHSFPSISTRAEDGPCEVPSRGSNTGPGPGSGHESPLPAAPNTFTDILVIDGASIENMFDKVENITHLTCAKNEVMR